MYFETSKTTAQKDLKFFFAIFFMKLILVIHHVFKMGGKFYFQFFEKIIVGEHQVGIFLNSPCDSIGKDPSENA